MSGFFIHDVTGTNGVVTMDLRGGRNNNDQVVITALDASITPADPADINPGTTHIVGGTGLSIEIQVGLLRKARDGIEVLLAKLTV